MNKAQNFAFTASLALASLFLASCGEHTFDDFWEDIFGSSSSAGEEELSSSSSSGQSRSSSAARNGSSSSISGGGSAECDAANPIPVPIILHGIPENHSKVPQWKAIISCMPNGWIRHLNEIHLGDQDYFTNVLNAATSTTGRASSADRRITLKVPTTDNVMGRNSLALLYHETSHVIDKAAYYSGETSAYTVDGRNFVQFWNDLTSDERNRFRSDGSRGEAFASCIGRTRQDLAEGAVGRGAKYVPDGLIPYALKFIEDIEAGRIGTYEGARYPELEKMHGTYRADNGAAIGLASDSFAWDSGNVHWVGNVDSYAYSSNGNAATKEAYPKGFKISGTIAETNERNKSAGDDFSQTIFFHPDFNSIARAGVIYYRQ